METAMKRAAIYVRVSTDEQTVENQLARLTEVAEARGWQIIHTYRDVASGAKGRDKRPGLDAMLKDAQRGKFNVLMAWSIDRLGRSLKGLLFTAEHLKDCGVDLYLDKQAIDTTTAAGKAMFAMTGVFAEFERDVIRDRVIAGMARARAQGKHLGRPAADPRKVRRARKLLGQGIGILRAAKLSKLGTGTVQKLKAELGAQA
jgi:DNA invertase Pin-like site-specific DNA recombinase